MADKHDWMVPVVLEEQGRIEAVVCVIECSYINSCYACAWCIQTSEVLALEHDRCSLWDRPGRSQGSR